MLKRIFIIIALLIIVFTIWFFIYTRPATAPTGEDELFLERGNLIQEEKKIFKE